MAYDRYSTSRPERPEQISTAINAAQVGGLMDVATSGAYADLSGKPTLGTMAAEAAADYLLLTGGTVGAMVFSSTVKMSGLPTSDPADAGALWIDGTTLKVSAG